MEFEPCFTEVHDLVVTQLNSTKLGQMTNLKVVFHMVVSIYKLQHDSVPRLTPKGPITAGPLKVFSSLLADATFLNNFP